MSFSRATKNLAGFLVFESQNPPLKRRVFGFISPVTLEKLSVRSKSTFSQFIRHRHKPWKSLLFLNHNTYAMKRIFVLLLIPLLFHAQSQNPEQRVESTIKAVTLYLDGAEINQQKALNLNAGITSVVFTNLSSKLIPKSIQVNLGEGISVLSVSEKLNFLSTSAETNN